jgi:colanic acid biosynthesis glycosyl transferase WcaI
VLEAAADPRLQACQFLICGEGAGKEELVSRKDVLRLPNVVFQGVQPNEQFVNLLVSADCHLIVQKAGVADAVLPSKLTNILAAGGNAVVTATAETSLGALCERHPGIAVRVSPDSARALADGICAALAMQRPNKVAIAFAKANLAIDAIMSRYRETLLALCLGTGRAKA